MSTGLPGRTERLVPSRNQRTTRSHSPTRLTAAQVTALDKDGVQWIAPSLYLQIRQGQGTKSYLFRWGKDGENQWMGLGSVADTSLSEIRDEATQLRSLVRKGGDPRGQSTNGHAQRAATPKPEKGAHLRMVRRPAPTSPRPPATWKRLLRRLHGVRLRPRSESSHLGTDARR
jgi:hypothetical protein